MPTFRDDLAARGWMMRSGGGGHREQPPFTHLFLDGGRASVPDSMHGLFLNLYVNALLRGEKLYVVETKTPTFKLFFDIDARYSGDPEAALDELKCLVEALHALVIQFWDIVDPIAIACTAPVKHDGDSFKVGVHVHFPGVIANAPIAMAFRSFALEHLKEHPLSAVNELDDILDACVFKANGLRLAYSGKVDEFRAYTPWCTVTAGGGVTFAAEKLSSESKRQFVHDTSIRVFDIPLTPCKSGIDKLADEAIFAHAKHRFGTQARLGEYADVLPKLHALLPKVYETQRFTGIFKTDHAIMLKSSARYCQNVKREHRTSTAYFTLTRRGLAQRCYCRKDDRGCVEYCSDWIRVPDEILEQILPKTMSMLPDPDIHVMPSKKTSMGNLHTLLSRCKPVGGNKRKKGKKR